MTFIKHKWKIKEYTWKLHVYIMQMENIGIESYIIQVEKYTIQLKIYTIQMKKFENCNVWHAFKILFKGIILFSLLFSWNDTKLFGVSCNYEQTGFCYVLIEL